MPDVILPENVVMPTSPKAGKFDVLVDKWFDESFRNTALARNTECWNLVHAARDDLKQRLAKED